MTSDEIALYSLLAAVTGLVLATVEVADILLQRRRGQGIVRECPHCISAISARATACRHCTQAVPLPIATELEELVEVQVGQGLLSRMIDRSLLALAVSLALVLLFFTVIIGYERGLTRVEAEGSLVGAAIAAIVYGLRFLLRRQRGKARRQALTVLQSRLTAGVPAGTIAFRDLRSRQNGTVDGARSLWQMGAFASIAAALVSYLYTSPDRVQTANTLGFLSLAAVCLALVSRHSRQTGSTLHFVAALAAFFTAMGAYWWLFRRNGLLVQHGWVFLVTGGVALAAAALFLLVRSRDRHSETKRQERHHH